ncbi:ATP-binding cassette transporter abc4 [Leucoagaricus sp. SymC.cos]|nr:ATP-binding cassette transporter abc4 [Leucoagaricus sp. SymC.cos]
MDMPLPTLAAPSFTMQSAYFVGQTMAEAWSVVRNPGIIESGLSHETLLIPSVAAITSCAAVVFIFFRSWVLGLLKSTVPVIERDGAGREDQRQPSLSSRDKFSQHIKAHGGPLTFCYQVLRLLCGIVLFVLTLLNIYHDFQHEPVIGETLVIEQDSSLFYGWFIGDGKHSKRWASITSRHVTPIYLLTFLVYAYRNLYPLVTSTLQPKDNWEGSLLWVKITLLFLSGVVIPLIIPREYVPFDPKNPMEPNPEQTASIFSMITYSFLDPIVFLAYRIPHLAHSQLPPLADYDYTHNLKVKSFRHLDLFSGAKNRHLFWGLLRIFSFEYVAMGVLVALMVFSSFASPIGINKLLSYLEKDGYDTNIKPWVWILWLFLGPLCASLCFQGYIFFATRTLVRCEAIITQLVFEHSLRIRVKAETENGKDEKSVVVTQAFTTSTTGSTDSAINASDEEATIRASSPSIQSTSSKGLSQSKNKKGQVSAAGTSSASNLVGLINNLVTTDLGNIIEARDLMLVLVYIPLQIILCMVFLYVFLGWSAFVGLAVMILLYPIPGFVAQKIQDVQNMRLKRTDARIETVTEAMNVLRMIKLFGWERKMNDRIAEKREKELEWLWKRQVLELINGNINFAIPVFVMVATFFTYVRIFNPSRPEVCLTLIMKEQLKPSIVFSSMTVFDLMRDQLFMAFFLVNSVIAGKVSLDRVDEFLKKTELIDSYTNQENSALLPSPEANDQRIGFNDATFAWSVDTDGALTPSKRKYLLHIEGELLFRRNKLNLIVGPTGSGKTSMLMALLSEMHYIPTGPSSWYNLPRKGGVAYAAQESWVQNEAIKENILFGSPYNEERYRKVLYQCGLERDLELFEAGDLTEVGEKGLTLSGGQKARVTLARAIYSPAEIVLLDDVLAALDVHTAKWIVDKCFAGDLLKNRTVLLVTHNIAMTRSLADFVVSIGTDGSVMAKGTVLEVLGADEAKSTALEADKETVQTAAGEVDKPITPESDGKLIVAEEIEEGHVSWKSVRLFLIGLGGNSPGLFFVSFLGGLLISDLITTFQTWYLGYWASQYETHDPSEVPVPYYLGIYVALLFAAVAFYMFSFTVYIFGVIRASRQLHQQLVQSVLGTTLRWLDTTPASRIITRCTQDVRAIDGPLKDNLKWLSEITITMGVKLSAVVLMTPIFLIPGIIVGAFGGWIGQIYMAAQLSVKREMSIAKSPVVGHFGAAIAGLTSIRAYSAEDAFIKGSMERINRYTRASRVYYNLNRWVCIRIDTISGLFAAGLGAYLVYFKSHSPSNVGFSLNMASEFDSMILWWIRNFNEFEVQGNSLERIHGYINIEQEPKPIKEGEPPAYWPASGSLVVENLSARYSKTGPKVLHDISFEVKSGERVGIVGRTGSGKSSLTLALLRCIFTEGNVHYDGLKTSNLNLDDLRSKVTIIPQIPELLSGSLRHNLDPFDQYDDATLNDALRAAGLFSLQADMDEGKITLETSIASGGGNLSVGQRQILALARAIVRGSKLLILDEATSAIDHKTDTAIQTSLRHELGHDTTVITIAHRLQTIMDADKIMVLDAGKIVEFDSPANLLKNENGFLHSLVEESGDKQRLYEMAGGKHSIESQ